MNIIKIINEKHQQNSYLIISEKDAVLIDASASVPEISEYLKMYSITSGLSAIFLTHAHFDHIANLDNLVKKYSCPVYIHESGKENLYDIEKNLSFLDTEPFKIKEKKGVKKFKDGQEFAFGDIVIRCYNTPGHSIDSSCFVVNDSMFTGDNVFKSQVGRTDLYSADEYVQKISLMRILNDLSQGVNNFYSGHGANFNKEELEYNLNRFLGEN